MFETCKTLMELNAARIKAIKDGFHVVEVNNAYNKKKQEIVSARNDFKKLQAIYIKPREVQLVAGIPICGRCQELNTIQLTPSGFLY